MWPNGTDRVRVYSGESTFISVRGSNLDTIIAELNDCKQRRVPVTDVEFFRVCFPDDFTSERLEELVDGLPLVRLSFWASRIAGRNYNRALTKVPLSYLNLCDTGVTPDDLQLQGLRTTELDISGNELRREHLEGLVGLPLITLSMYIDATMVPARDLEVLRGHPTTRLTLVIRQPSVAHLEALQCLPLQHLRIQLTEGYLSGGHLGAVRQLGLSNFHLHLLGGIMNSVDLPGLQAFKAEEETKVEMGGAVGGSGGERDEAERWLEIINMA